MSMFELVATGGGLLFIASCIKVIKQSKAERWKMVMFISIIIFFISILIGR